MNPESLNPARCAPIVLAFLWGCVVALVQTHTLFLIPAGHFFDNHDHEGTMLRVCEFRECLESGYLFPQWCTDFRRGFGSPYFSYYQPGFYYIASLMPRSLSLVHGVGVAAWALSLAGYLATFLLVARRFGTIGGVLAGTTFALSQYATTDLFVRGDFAEFAAMMTIPAILYWLDGWLESGGGGQFAGFAATSGLLITLHACIALAGFAFLALALGVHCLSRRVRNRALLGFIALALGMGTAGFYWLPVLFEWDLVAPRGAFVGPYHFAKHFIEPVSLVTAQRSDPVPISLDVITLALLAVAVASAVRNWNRMNGSQQRLFLTATGMLGFAVFLMSSMSSSLWETLPLLYRLQFPWRLLSLISVAVAVLAGCLVPWKNRAIMAACVGLAALNLCLIAVFDSKREIRLISFAEPQSAAEIANSYFAPDHANEWLPREATIRGNEAITRNVIAPPGTQITGYHQEQGLLKCDVKAERAVQIDLPHLYFSAGWTATVDGREVPITASPVGLMRIVLPANSEGRLEVRFSMTPMRRLGAGISLISLILLGGIALVPRLGKWQLKQDAG